MMEYLDLAIKRPATLLFSIMEKMFVVMGEVNVGPRPANISPIAQVILVDVCVYLLLLFVFTKLFMSTKYVMVVVTTKDVDLGSKRTATILLK